MGKRKQKKKFKRSEVVNSPNPKTTVQKIKPAKKKYWISVLVLLVITFVVFLPSLSLNFVNWDDPDNLLNNKNLDAFAHQWSWAAVKSIFTSAVFGGYNPLSIFTFAIEKYFFAPDPNSAPFIFHFNNVWMHLVCTVCVFFIFINLGLARIDALFESL